MPERASPELIARVSENFEWWNGAAPELMLNEYAEDAELDVSAVFTDTPPLRGHAGIRHQLDEWWETWEGLRIDPLEVLVVGGGRFVVEVRIWGKGKRSGAEVDQRFAFVYTLRQSDNLIARAQLFPNMDAALNFARGERPRRAVRAGGTDAST
jgi:ketosteroid isomerase-like protein